MHVLETVKSAEEPVAFDQWGAYAQGIRNEINGFGGDELEHTFLSKSFFKFDTSVKAKGV